MGNIDSASNLAFRTKCPYAKAAGDEGRNPRNPEWYGLIAKLYGDVQNCPHRLKHGDDAEDAARHRRVAVAFHDAPPLKPNAVAVMPNGWRVSGEPRSEA